MAKTEGQLESEIAAALKTTKVGINKLFAWRPKLEETVADIDAGRLSHASGKPLTVSRLDTPRGAYMILDGHHRAVEALLAGRQSIDVAVNPFVPRIERAGGAYASYITDKVNVTDFVKRRVRG